LSRDFAVIVERARAAASLQVLGEVDGLPLLAARIGIGAGEPQGLLIAGTHGDEPATVEAALQVIERPLGDWAGGLSLDVLPCTNPTGYVRNTRETVQGVDVNWAWTRTDVAEIQILRRFLSGRRYQFVLDFHEDWETTGFYLYEHRLGVDAAGPKMIDAVEPIIPINADPEIEGWPAVKGVVTADSSAERLNRGDGFPMVILRDHTPHKLTTETPTELPIPLRAQAHLATLDALLEHYGDRL
jgi:protein MpaA